MPNYDHANFYWRMELQPEEAATASSSTTIGNSTLGMLANDFVGAADSHHTRDRARRRNGRWFRIRRHALTVTPAWTVTPDTTSYFMVAEVDLEFRRLGRDESGEHRRAEPAGRTVEISGRSANAHDDESAEALNPVTTWQIGGAMREAAWTAEFRADADVWIGPGGAGDVRPGRASGFRTLTNTHTDYRRGR